MATSNPTQTAGMILQQAADKSPAATFPIDGFGIPQQIVKDLLAKMQAYAESAFTSRNTASNAAATASTSALAATQAASTATNTALKAWAYVQNFRVTSVTRRADGAVTSANIAWPDGTLGVYTALVFNAKITNATDSWQATYVGTTTKTILQPTITRDSTGAVIVQPDIIIT